MIYVTGDTHRDLDWKKINTENFPEQKEMTRDDYLIIMGDFGGVWYDNRKDNFILDTYERKPFTTLFIGGNHENWDALNLYPIEIWNGGKIHRIRPHVLHLMNGQVFHIDDKNFFVMGGASSNDKEIRKENISWWSSEEPNKKDYEDAERNLQIIDYKVDYILTHTIPGDLDTEVLRNGKQIIGSKVEKYLNTVLLQVDYSKWFAGHLHRDLYLPEYKLQILYEKVICVFSNT